MPGVGFAPAGPGLRGRQDECAALDALLAGVRARRSGVLVLRGEAGIGKTALLRYLIESASDLTVARAVGVESEMELAFAGLHQLCLPLLHRLDRLPAPQREALEIVFALSDGTAPDRFLMGLGVLSLFSEVAEDRPLLCVVDDAQWLDQASALTLAFVARRLLAEPVGIVFAAREPGEELQHLPELTLRGLRNGDARAVLGSAVGLILDGRVRDRIIAETRGNPLALLELPREFTAAQLAVGFGLPGVLSLQGKIEESFARRIRTMSDDARRLLLVAAAEPVGDPLLLWRAANELGIRPAAGEDAEKQNLLTIRERVVFRHPLVRSAAYGSATNEERRAAHLALAEATDRETDPDRRAWHLAAAAAGPDEQVASELEGSAGRAQARGGLAAAAAFLQRAVALTVDREKRTGRALTAAQASLNAGAFDTARGLINVAEDGPLDQAQRAQADMVRAQLAFASRRGTEAIPLLLSAAQRLEPLDMQLARETYLDTFSAALFGARLNESIGVPEVARAARGALAETSDTESAVDLLLTGLVALTEDYEAGVLASRKALDKLKGDQTSPAERLRWLWQGCVVALELWDDESAYTLSDRAVDLARRTGTLSELALAMSAYAPILLFCGELAAASSIVAETKSVEEATGIRSAPYGALLLAAWRGRPQETTDLIARTMQEATARGEGIGIAICEYAQAVLRNGSGDYSDALAAACSASEFREVVAENWGLSELVEPAARTGRMDVAEEALARLARKARATGSDWARGVEMRSRALLSAGDDAESFFREAIDHFGRTRVRAELARTHLLYAEWLRRANRRVDARVELNRAHELFAAMGMEGFAERARRESSGAGEHAHNPTVETHDDLTEQERQIAGLARDGLSNQEIGSRLFLSQHTVAYHLRKVFSKLAITSRNQLAQVLPDGVDSASVA